MFFLKKYVIHFSHPWHPWHRRTPRHRRGDEALRGAVLALGVDVHVAAELRGGDFGDLTEAEFSMGKMEDVGGFSMDFREICNGFLGIF